MISILKILTGGGGVKNPENYADVICTWPLTLSRPSRPILFIIARRGESLEYITFYRLPLFPSSLSIPRPISLISQRAVGKF